MAWAAGLVAGFMYVCKEEGVDRVADRLQSTDRRQGVRHRRIVAWEVASSVSRVWHMLCAHAMSRLRLHLAWLHAGGLHAPYHHRGA